MKSYPKWHQKKGIICITDKIDANKVLKRFWHKYAQMFSWDKVANFLMKQRLGSLIQIQIFFQVFKKNVHTKNAISTKLLK